MSSSTATHPGLRLTFRPPPFDTVRRRSRTETAPTSPPYTRETPLMGLNVVARPRGVGDPRLATVSFDTICMR